MKKYYLILVFACVVFSGCTSIPPEDILYVRMETAIRKFINKNRSPKGYQIAAFAYKDESLKGGIKKLTNGKVRVFIGQWEISRLPKKGHYTAFIGKRFSNGNYYESHSLRLELKQNKDNSFKVISNQPVKKWGKLNRQETVNQLIANFKKSNDKNYKISVISTLGKLRAIEAIPFLIRNIRYEEGKIQFYPRKLTYAGKALSKIGSPCIIPILDVIPKISDAFRVEHLTNVLVDIHSHNLTIAYLQKKIAETKDLREKQLFEYTLKRIIKHKKSREKKLLIQKDKKDETFVYGKPTFGFALAIKPQIKKYYFGNVVFAIVRIKNVSDKESSVIIHNFTLQYFFEVTDLAGKKIPKLLYQKDIDRKIKEGLSFTRIFAQPVKSGEFLEYKLNLSKRFDLTMGKSYIVQGYRDIRKYDPITKKRSHSKVYSPKVKFTIK